MKKIAVNTVKALIKKQSTNSVITKEMPIGDSLIEVQVQTSLTMAEKSIFINRVLSGCFDGASNFRPEYITPMLRATILQMCTNIPVITLKNEQGDDGGSLMDIDAMDNLYVAMDFDQLAITDDRYQSLMSEMISLCNLAIDWKKDKVLALASKSDTSAFDDFSAASRAVMNLAESLRKKTEEMDVGNLLQYAGQLSEATKGLDEGSIVKGLLEIKDLKATH